ncbi:MAG TPA: adenylate kinase family protein [Candidatus Sulfotelmatobacter sp.]|nr:adenylate kinase family protein [Candidatus Sulfotelmatobacter sp.]
MHKQVILITGTPCVGKTTVAKSLTKKLDALYVNLTDTAKKYDLTLGEDKERQTTIIDEDRMKSKLGEIIDSAQKDSVIIDGHYAAAIVSKNQVSRTFVLRRNPVQLREFMVKCGFKDQKLWENLASEILDVCLVEALNNQDQKRVCELDVTDKTVEEIIEDILAILNNNKVCRTGGIDWLGMLEQEGKLDEYLRM